MPSHGPPERSSFLREVAGGGITGAEQLGGAGPQGLEQATHVWHQHPVGARNPITTATLDILAGDDGCVRQAGLLHHTG